MLVIVAINAEQLPVAAVRRVVVMIVVAVMYGQLTQILTGEFTRATPTDPRIEFQGLFAIALLALLTRAPRLGNNPVEPVCILPAQYRPRSII